MNEGQEKFWKILSEPYKKTCHNCVHSNFEYDRLDCSLILLNPCATFNIMTGYEPEGPDHWVWNEEHE